MNEEERAFREGLRQAVADRPGGVRVDIDEVIARASAPDCVPETRWTPPRWLAAAAAVLVVAGLGVGMAVLRPSGGLPATPAAPVATSSESSQFDAADLVGSKWLAVQIAGRGVAAGPDGHVPSVTFTSATELTFYDGCNYGMATYRLSLGLHPEFSVTLGPIGAVGCLKGDQARFEDALTSAASVQKNGKLLEFLDSNDKVVLQFARVNGWVMPQQTRPPSPNPTRSWDVEISSPATGTPTNPPPAAGAVHVRLYNDTGITLHAVKVGFPDGFVISEATLEPGTYSEYLSPDVAYRSASLEATADGHPYRTTPTNYVGEEPLEPGDYTYSIRLTEGVMFLEFSQG